MQLKEETPELQETTGSNTLNLCNDIFQRRLRVAEKKVLTDGSKGDKDLCQLGFSTNYIEICHRNKIR